MKFFRCRQSHTKIKHLYSVVESLLVLRTLQHFFISIFTSKYFPPE